MKVDFLLEVATEKVSGAGEDAYVYRLDKELALAGVFDGCGGSGAQRYQAAGKHTGAYLASRVLAGAVRDWAAAGDAQAAAEAGAASLTTRAASYLATARAAVAERTALAGSLSKELPTTCALLVADLSARELRVLWAGDSRCYLLDEGGLHQLTADDLDGYDPMENLHADGALTNVVSASQAFELHTAVVPAAGPCVAFAATDGCFGYLPTPMDFEHLLLSTLAKSPSPAAWERRLAATFAELAGDDATLCGVSLGFGGWSELKSALAPRLEDLTTTYIEPLRAGEDPSALWARYRAGYEAQTA